MTQLVISKLRSSIEKKEILKGVSLSIRSGSVHAIMGPNGSGKSTLAQVLAGHPAYTVSARSTVSIGKSKVLTKEPQERAQMGLFLAFQTPVTIAGVSVFNLLRTAYQALHPSGKTNKHDQRITKFGPSTVGALSTSEFLGMVKNHTKALRLDESFLSRSINDGFSGGERKKVEMLQALVLSPKFAVFDEIDTGLDVDALKSVSLGIETLRKSGCGVLIITHYQRILKYVTPDHVHVLVAGKIVKSGKAQLAHEIEDTGYAKYL